MSEPKPLPCWQSEHGIPQGTVLHVETCEYCGGKIEMKVGPKRVWGSCGNVDPDIGGLCDNQSRPGPNTSFKIIKAYRGATAKENQKSDLSTEPAVKQPAPAAVEQPESGTAENDGGKAGGDKPGKSGEWGTAFD